ncbi:MAG: class I SAM-dependent methyltransferase [Eggerthellaceae bacterium]|nr:class I SAM-dependent methyltransferase [Eggerthellaceae bacterium]
MSDRLTNEYRQIEIPDTAGGGTRSVNVLDRNADQFAARLRKNWKERRKWAARNDVHAFRIYDADLPDFSVAIDVYEDVSVAPVDGAPRRFLHIAEYAPPASVDPERARNRFDDVLAIAPVVCGIPSERLFSKVRRRDKGGSQYRLGNRGNCVFVTREGGLDFEVDLNGYLDTGLFLDHRDTRMMVGRMARGKRFLNLFAYTGSATVHAAAGGAACTVTVDLSQTYLDWARRNMILNGFNGDKHLFQKADATAWAAQVARTDLRFDLVFVDPPTFSNSKSMGERTWDVQRDHVRLLSDVVRLLAPGGVAVFSCNLRSFKPDGESLAAAGVSLEDITARTIPHDFERNPKIHRCFLAKRA